MGWWEAAAVGGDMVAVAVERAATAWERGRGSWAAAAAAEVVEAVVVERAAAA